jgi:hypothetical protein
MIFPLCRLILTAGHFPTIWEPNDRPFSAVWSSPSWLQDFPVAWGSSNNRMAVHSTCSFKHSPQIFEHLILPFKFSRNLAILALNLKLLSFLPKIISCQPIVGFPKILRHRKNNNYNYFGSPKNLIKQSRIF